MPNAPAAGVPRLLHEGSVEIDVPSRQCRVVAMMKRQTHTFAPGVTHRVRLRWAIGPGFAGWSMQAVTIGRPLVVSAATKTGYGPMLWRAFRDVEPPEERI